MATFTPWRGGSRNAEYAGRRAANSQAMRLLAQAGLAARGIMYVIIGWIAVQGGRILVVVIGLALIGGGLYLAYQAWRKDFRRNLEPRQLPAGARRVVDWLGEFGGIARGIVFVTAGVFLVVAAAEAQPQQAKGVDSSLRALAATPLGPWLLVLVAAGLIMFGVFSCREAKWLRL